MDVLQKGAGLIVAARPVAHDGNVAAIGEAETGDVDGVAEGVLGDLGARNAVHAAAAIGAHAHDFDDALAEARLRRRLHHVAQPFVERGDHRAVERIGVVEADSAVGQRGDAQGPGQAADAGPVDFARGLDIGRERKGPLGETDVLRLGAPSRPLRRLIIGAAGQRCDERRQRGKWQDATRHPVKMSANF